MKEKFPFKQPEERIREDKLKSQERRDFLKLGLGAAAALAGGGFVKGIYDMGKKIEERENTKQPKAENSQAVNIPEEQILPTEEFEKVELDWEDKKILKQILKPSVHNELRINIDTIGVITKYWIHENQTRGKQALFNAYEEMNKIKPLLDDCFSRHGVPTEFIYLAIPESGWRMDAVSRSGAQGPYQFMPETAQEYGLKNPFDPIESADACARFLRDLYKRTNNWDLALAGYNGGFMGRYEKKCKATNQEMNYEGFLAMLENKINEKRQDILSRKYFYYKVKEGDSVYKICRQYGVKYEEFISINKLKEIIKPANGKDKRKSKIEIYPNQRLILPLNKKVQQIKFEEEVAGYLENINYPPKFNATLKGLGLKDVEYVASWEQKKDENA